MLTRAETHAGYREAIAQAKEAGQEREALRWLCQNDLFYLLVYGLKRTDADHDWLYERCREVQASPNGYLDLWSREHYKSTIITYALTIQDILNDPEITIAIFSLNRPLAKSFLSQIKEELEGNEALKQLFPDVLYDNPRKESPKWSLDTGIIVRREGNPRESTVAAWGLVDAMPTGHHYKIRVYDDIIDERNCTNTDMIAKATKAWELSLNLGSAQPVPRYGKANIERYVGTRYHANDPYKTIMDREAADKRIYPGTHNGKENGVAVLWDQAFLQDKRKKMGPYIFNCQILQNPLADKAMGFELSWCRFWSPYKHQDRVDEMNVYLLVDPAGEKKEFSDYTSMWVVGLAEDQNTYVIDILRDRLNLTERTDALFKFHRKYRPLDVGYEKYGKDSDIEHIEYVMGKRNYHFEITPVGGPMPKNDRIRRLVPDFEQGRIYLPDKCIYVNRERQSVDMTQVFLNEEYVPFPVAVHDDMLDGFSRLKDIEVEWPDPVVAVDDSPFGVYTEAFDNSGHADHPAESGWPSNPAEVGW